MGKKNKNRLGVVFSTDPDFEYREQQEEVLETLAPGEQNLNIYLDKKHRKGKAVTIIENFIGHEDDLKQLGKLLKTKCGVGGSVKDSQILIQGDFRNKVKEILIYQGFKFRQ